MEVNDRVGVIAPGYAGWAATHTGYRITTTNACWQLIKGVRVALPSARAAGGKPRCDAEYYHQPGEVSVWVPLCGCVAANALHVATGPGDDAPLLPLPLKHGEWAAWSGHRCRSGFVANTSADASVSLDFRVIPWSSYREDRSAAKKSNHNLRLGSYYAVMDAAEPADS